MAWRLAKSLSTLRDEIGAVAPKRSRLSDGTIGDPAHASRASRHNPNRHRVVTAIDITHDPKGGMDVHALARRLVKDPHPELEYVISNGQVAKRRTGFAWETYRGSNQHVSHAHFAVGRGPDSDPLPPYDSTAPWGVAVQTTKENDMEPRAFVKAGFLAALGRYPSDETEMANHLAYLAFHGQEKFLDNLASSAEGKARLT